jgi:hypothetical protein
VLLQRPCVLLLPASPPAQQPLPAFPQQQAHALQQGISMKAVYKQEQQQLVSYKGVKGKASRIYQLRVSNKLTSFRKVST